MFVPATKKVYNWEEYTLLVPVVSVGNVGQLTADLIISTLWMDRIGYILHDAITPAVGNNPFAHADATSCKSQAESCPKVHIPLGFGQLLPQLYESAATQVMAIQQRAPLVKGRVKSYVKFLSEWIREKNFHQVVIVGSTFSHERLDYQMQGPPFRVVMTNKLREREEDVVLNRLGWMEMESRPGLDGDASSLTGSLFLPGSGIAKSLLEACQDLPVLLFLMFCSEGDNAQDAIDVAQQLNGWMNLIGKREERRGSMISKDVAQGIVDWKIPTSWKHFYGTKFDQTLFH